MNWEKIKIKIVTSREARLRPQIMDLEKANQYLQDLKKVFDEFKIPFCLFYGTLLGAIRENDFILWDADVDVAVLKPYVNDYKKVIELSERFKELGYTLGTTTLYNNKINMLHLYKSQKKYVYVDVYFLFDFQDKYWFPRLTSIQKEPYYTSIPYEKKYFENMKTINFKGAEYLVPTPPEEFLEKMWGEWWIAGGGQFGIIQATHFKPEDFKAKEIV